MITILDGSLSTGSQWDNIPQDEYRNSETLSIGSLMRFRATFVTNESAPKKVDIKFYLIEFDDVAGTKAAGLKGQPETQFSNNYYTVENFDPSAPSNVEWPMEIGSNSSEKFTQWKIYMKSYMVFGKWVLEFHGKMQLLQDIHDKYASSDPVQSAGLRNKWRLLLPSINSPTDLRDIDIVNERSTSIYSGWGGFSVKLFLNDGDKSSLTPQQYNTRWTNKIAQQLRLTWRWYNKDIFNSGVPNPNPGFTGAIINFKFSAKDINNPALNLEKLGYRNSPIRIDLSFGLDKSKYQNLNDAKLFDARPRVFVYILRTDKTDAEIVAQDYFTYYEGDMAYLKPDNPLDSPLPHDEPHPNTVDLRMPRRANPYLRGPSHLEKVTPTPSTIDLYEGYYHIESKNFVPGGQYCAYHIVTYDAHGLSDINGYFPITSFTFNCERMVGTKKVTDESKIIEPAIPEVQAFFIDQLYRLDTNKLVASPQERIVAVWKFKAEEYDLNNRGDSTGIRNGVYLLYNSKRVRIQVYRITGTQGQQLKHVYDDVTVTRGTNGKWVLSNPMDPNRYLKVMDFYDDGVTTVTDPFNYPDRYLMVEYFFRIRYEENIKNFATYTYPGNGMFSNATDNQDWTDKNFIIECTVEIEDQGSNFRDTFEYPMELQVHKYDPEHEDAVDVEFTNSTDRDAKPITFVCDGYGDNLRVKVTCKNKTDRLFLASLIDKTDYGITNVKEIETTVGEGAIHDYTIPPYSRSWEFYGWNLLSERPLSNHKDFSNCIAWTDINVDELSKEGKYRYAAIVKGKLTNTGSFGNIWNTDAVKQSPNPNNPNFKINDTIANIEISNNIFGLDVIREEYTNVPTTDVTFFLFREPNPNLPTHDITRYAEHSDGNPITNSDYYIREKRSTVYYLTNPNINFALGGSNERYLNNIYNNWMAIADTLLPNILNLGIDYIGSLVNQSRLDIDTVIKPYRNCINPVITNYHLFMEDDRTVRSKVDILGSDDAWYGDFVFYNTFQLERLREKVGYSIDFEKQYETTESIVWRYRTKWGYELIHLHKDDIFLGFVLETIYKDDNSPEYHIYAVGRQEDVRFDMPLGSHYNENYYLYLNKTDNSTKYSSHTYYGIRGCGIDTAAPPAMLNFFNIDSNSLDGPEDYVRCVYEEIPGSGIKRPIEIAPGYTLVGFVFDTMKYIPITVYNANKMCMTQNQVAETIGITETALLRESIKPYDPIAKAQVSDTYKTATSNRIRKTNVGLMDMSGYNDLYDGPLTEIENHGNKILVWGGNSTNEFSAYSGVKRGWGNMRIDNSLNSLSSYVKLGRLPMSFKFVLDPMDFTPNLRTLLCWGDKNFNEMLLIQIMPDLKISVSLSNYSSKVEVISKNFIVPGFMNSIYVNICTDDSSKWEIIINGVSSALIEKDNIIGGDRVSLNTTWWNGDICLLAFPNKDSGDYVGSFSSASRPFWGCFHSAQMYSRYVSVHEARQNYEDGVMNDMGYQKGLVFSVDSIPDNRTWKYIERHGHDLLVDIGT